MRERLEQHRKNPSCCAVCHNLMDPIGFGLESYDAVGAWRTKDGKFPIDTSGTLPDGKSFQRREGSEADSAAASPTPSRATSPRRC